MESKESTSVDAHTRLDAADRFQNRESAAERQKHGFNYISVGLPTKFT